MVKNRLQCRRPEFNPWVGKILGEGNGNPLQYSGLENSMEKGAWWTIVPGITDSQTPVSDYTATMITRLKRIEKRKRKT